MTLRYKLYCYTLAVHCLLLAGGVYFLKQDHIVVFFAVELITIISLIIGFYLINKTSDPTKLIEFSKEIFRDHNFNSRLKSSGMNELNDLVVLFNEMLEQLYQEQLKLGEQRGFYDKLLQATPVGLIIFDYDDRINKVNPAAEALFNLGFDALQGKMLNELDAPLADAIVQNSDTLPSIISLSGGQRYRVQSSSFIDRGFKRNFLMIEELTVEMRAAERNAYENLIRMTNHEVNNTIGATNSLLQGWQSYGRQLANEDREDFNRALEVVINRNSRLSDFMQRLAQVVRIPAPQCQSTDLKQLIENVGAMFSAELKNRNIQWHFRSQEIPTLLLDPNLFEQALINIIKNAYEAVDRQGTIDVNLEEREGSVYLAITDSAGALNEANKHSIFQPFYSSKKNGQGIGLMLVREILNLHGFEYEITCVANEYTCFQIKLTSDHVLAEIKDTTQTPDRNDTTCDREQIP